MDNKYEVIDEEVIDKKTKLYSIKDLINNDIYTCVIKKESDKKTRVLYDEAANMFDIGEALFQYDLDILPLLPRNMITPDMFREYQDYYPGKGNCIYDNDKIFEKVYLEEENRVNKLRNIKQLVK